MAESVIASAQQGVAGKGEELDLVDTNPKGIAGGLVGVGKGGGADFGRLDSTGSNSSITAPNPRKPLRKKSVSFTGEESYQILRGVTPPSPPSQEAARVGSQKVGSSPGGVAPASAFFLRSNRANSPMVTPHAAYAVRAKKVFPSVSKAASVVTHISHALVGASPVANSHSNGSAGAGTLSSPPPAVGGSRSGPSLVRGNLALMRSDAIRFDDALAQKQQQSLRQVSRPSLASSPSSTRTTPADDSSASHAVSARAAPTAADDAAEESAAAPSAPGGNVDGIGASKRRRIESNLSGGVANADAEEAGGREAEAASAVPSESSAVNDAERPQQGSVLKGSSGGSADPRMGDEGDEAALEAETDQGRHGVEIVDLTEVGSGFETPSGLPPLNRLDSSGSSGAAAYEDVIDRQVQEEEDDEEDEDGRNADNDEESPYFSDENCALGDNAVYSPGFDNDSGRWSAVPSPEKPSNHVANNNYINDQNRNLNGSGHRSRRRDSWEIGSRYEFIRTLGHGSYGEVAQCKDLHEGAMVAIKRLLNVFESEVDAKRIYREMYILRHTKHEEIIHLRDVIQPPSYEGFRDLYLVFEFVDTDLYKLIGSPQFLTDEHIKLFMYQMLIGLKYVHSAHVIHRDMKPANILLNEDCTLKICDFGLSRVVTQDPPPVVATRSPPRAACGCNSSAAGKLACSPVKPSSLPPGVAAPSTGSNGLCHGPGGSCHAGQSSEGSGAGDAEFDDEPPQQATRTLKRQLTKHVVTRWYRAPELILLQDYNNAVDVWSVGCILAELLSMQETSFPTSQERNALFPGKTCFPLSADQPSSYSDALDQLNVIFDVIGTPSAEDIEGLGEVRQYLARLNPKRPLDLKDKYAGASSSALELLTMMLRFDPAKRITVDEALEHPYLASCRKQEREVTAKTPITMEFENIKTDKATLKRLVYEEVQHYHRPRHSYPPAPFGSNAGLVRTTHGTQEEGTAGTKPTRRGYESPPLSTADSGTDLGSFSGPVSGSSRAPETAVDEEESNKRRRKEVYEVDSSFSSAASGEPFRRSVPRSSRHESESGGAGQKRQRGQ